MRSRITAAFSVAIVLTGLSFYTLGVHAQNARMGHREPHMSAAFGHLEQAKAELEKAAPNKGGHRERAMQLVDQAMQEIREGERYDQTHPGSL
jgi:hypothetical protein